ncbi:hypothetical protein [Paraburkholderia sp. HD33-4]|uniref:hypothetical protein n=1 Tax=Paraburkholderia sp. HD33-4 TaxID=2883242 RepID=UPI001F2E7850|nr:hypothetical protein [Paraburkholderia sp. HD33-4]
MSYELAEQDLAHIRHVLDYLECSTRYVYQVEGGAVASLNYWRGRVRMTLVMPLLPMHIEKQAKALLCRMDSLEGTHRREGASSNARWPSAH